MRRAVIVVMLGKGLYAKTGWCIRVSRGGSEGRDSTDQELLYLIRPVSYKASTVVLGDSLLPPELSKVRYLSLRRYNAETGFENDDLNFDVFQFSISKNLLV